MGVEKCNMGSRKDAGKPEQIMKRYLQSLTE